MTVDRLEMFRLLKENPKREAIQVIDFLGYEVKIPVKVIGNTIMYLSPNGLSSNVLMLTEDKSEFEIIEPQKKLREMDFGEAYWHLTINCLDGYELISCISGKTFARSDIEIDQEEFMGKWTIEGIYEEESI